jgi:hypothetical protein
VMENPRPLVRLHSISGVQISLLPIGRCGHNWSHRATSSGTVVGALLTEC